MSWSTSLNVIPGNILKGLANGLPFKCLLYFCRVITTLCNVMTKTIPIKQKKKKIVLIYDWIRNTGKFYFNESVMFNIC